MESYRPLILINIPHHEIPLLLILNTMERLPGRQLSQLQSLAIYHSKHKVLKKALVNYKGISTLEIKKNEEECNEKTS